MAGHDRLQPAYRAGRRGDLFLETAHLGGRPQLVEPDPLIAHGVAGTPKTEGPRPGAKRRPAYLAPSGCDVRKLLRSGPATTRWPPIHSRSMQPSGRTRPVVPSDSAVQAVDPAIDDGHSRYTIASVSRRAQRAAPAYS